LRQSLQEQAGAKRKLYFGTDLSRFGFLYQQLGFTMPPQLPCDDRVLRGMRYTLTKRDGKLLLQQLVHGVAGRRDGVPGMSSDTSTAIPPLSRLSLPFPPSIQPVSNELALGPHLGRIRMPRMGYPRHRMQQQHEVKVCRAGPRNTDSPFTSRRCSIDASHRLRSRPSACDGGCKKLLVLGMYTWRYRRTDLL
jgi:hypothetical protein